MVAPVFQELNQKEIGILARKMARVQDNPKVPDSMALDTEEIFRDLTWEAIRKWNEGKWT